MRSTTAKLVAFGTAILTFASSFGQEPAKDKPVKTDSPAPRAADSDAPLAEGWPGATRPGRIEVKTYPVYRSAVARAKGAGAKADGALFWPLFNHISRKGVEMTTPVVSTYTTEMIENPSAPGEMSMEFVYRTSTMGETGNGVGAVKVEDHPAATYVCLGIQGRMTVKLMRDGVAKVETWLGEHKSEWVQDGQSRRLGYHGPMTPVSERLWEVQIPVKRVGTNAVAPTKPVK